MSQALVFDQHTQSTKNLAWWLYIFHAVSLLFALGAFSWIPLLISYIKRGDAAGTFVYSHHTWQIHSFWWYVFWMLVGGVCFATVIGIPLAYLIWCVAWFWKALRLLRGLKALNDNRPIPS